METLISVMTTLIFFALFRKAAGNEAGDSIKEKLLTPTSTQPPPVRIGRVARGDHTLY